MKDYRHQLWINILEDLGPPEGCVLPGWLICVFVLVFPLQGLAGLLDRALGFDLFRCSWTIYGVHYSRAFFHMLAQANGEVYRISRRDDVLHVERLSEEDPCKNW